MRSWSKALGLLATGLVSWGGWTSSASAQFPTAGGGMIPPGLEMPLGAGTPPGGFSGGATAYGPPTGKAHAGPSKEPVSPFSLKDDGSPNGFNEGIDPHALEPFRFQISAGYSLLWFKTAKFPPLVTTGDPLDAVPGALGQPGTSILSNGLGDPNISAAFRIAATYWLLDPECLALESNFFIMEQRTQFKSFVSDEVNLPVLTRPFFNPNPIAQEDALPLAFPGFSTGATSDALTTRLMGAEVNFKWYTAGDYEGAGINVLLGVRWLRLDERYSNFDVTTDNANVTTTFSDRFTTYNRFLGGQVGLEGRYRWERFTFNLAGKLAVGPNEQVIQITGETVQRDAVNQTVIVDQQGLFAMPSNVGVYRNSKLAILPEFNAKLQFDVTERIRFNLGYTFFLLNNTVRPGDQIDRTVNIQPLLFGEIIPPALPAPPTSRQSIFNAQMLNLELEFLF